MAVEQMRREIDRFLGTPYVKGGSSVTGTDCSGFVIEVYQRAAGIELPHSAIAMSLLGEGVSRSELSFGDLLFFDMPGDGPSHVGIYIGDGRFVHASQTSGVTISALEEPLYERSYRSARRILR